MQKKCQWSEKSFKFSSKQAHNGPIIGLTPHTPTSFLTSSQDHTIRLWDIRSQSSIKLIRNNQLSQNLSSPCSDSINLVYVGSGTSLYQFDLRMGDVFVEDVSRMGKDQHYDQINGVRYSCRYGELVCWDDQGDIRAYSVGHGKEGEKEAQKKEEKLQDIKQQQRNKQQQHQNQPNPQQSQQPQNTINSKHLHNRFRLQQQHTNICNSAQYLYCESKAFQGKRLCVSGGYDSTLIIWSIQDEIPIKKISIQDIFNKYHIQSQNPPFVYNVSCYGSNILAALETGHILCTPAQEPKKPKFLLQASLTKISDCKVVKLQSSNKNILLSGALDQSFSMFDFEQRVDGVPKFMVKCKTIAETVQVDVVGGIILVVCDSPKLSFYHLKQ